MDRCRIHKLVTDVALVAGGRVALARYADVSRLDGQRGWFLPDDYLEHGEHPADAAARIVRTQLGIEPPALRLAEIESFGNGAWHLVFHYQGTLIDDQEIRPGENVAAASWFSLGELPPASEVAHEGWAIEVLGRTCTPET
jgi:ADP-ribose pyrophosphatase YjhB (NUDIX family)